jgi:cytochrome c-type biogenesis protein CcmH/NrfG
LRDNLIAAAADLYDVLQNDPNDVEAHCLLAEVLQARDQIDTARTHFERALEIDPACAWAAAGLKALGRAQAPPAPEEPTPRLTSVNVGMKVTDRHP